MARSDPSAASQRKARYGVAIFPVGRTNILRTGFAVNTDAITQVPAPGFQRIATDKLLRRIPALPARACLSACGAGRRRRLGARARRRCWRGALGLRLWGIKHGLPFVYNVDEASNFVPTAVSYYFTDSYNPHYFINPPAFSYLLHVVLGIWFGEAGRSAPTTRSARASRPTRRAVFVVSRASRRRCSGTAAVGVRLPDRRAALRPPRRAASPALVMAVAFLPVFYSHLALNDVPALLPLAVSVVRQRGRADARARRATTRSRAPGWAWRRPPSTRPGSCVLPLLVACGVAAVGPERARGPAGRGGRGWRSPPRASSSANPHALLSFDEFWSDVRKQEEAASGFGKLGLDYDSGILYYLWVLTWGFGWVPLAAALAGAVRRLQRGRAPRAVPGPVAARVHRLHGTQERYFGRWLLPAFPALALLAGLAVVRAGRRARGRGRARVSRWRRAASRRCSRPGPLLQRARRTACSRATTRATWRATGWCANVPAGLEGRGRADRPGRVVRGRRTSHDARDGARAAGSTRSGRRWIKFPTGRTTVDEQGRTLPRRQGALRAASRTTSAPCARR